MAHYFQRAEKLPRSEKEYIRSFDLIVSYLHDPGGVLLKHLNETGAENIITISPMVSKCHAVDHFYGAIKDVVGGKYAPMGVAKTWTHFIKCVHGTAPPEEQFLLKWPQPLMEEARLRLFGYLGEKRVIIIHPGSGSSAKNWPAEQFAALAKKIRATKSFEPVIIGGEADTKALVVMRRLLPGFFIRENLSLMDVASVLSAAAGYVGNDSGVTHLAAILGIPVIALFGPTDPAVWAPRGKNVRVITSRRMTTESLAEIGVTSVFSALKKYLQF